jgi:phage shock protein A
MNFTQVENPTYEEKQELSSIREALDKIRMQIWDMSLAIEKRSPDVPIIPRAPQPKTVFSWEKHEAKAIANQPKRKLQSKIEKMKRQLEKLKTEENQLSLPVED